MPLATAKSRALYACFADLKRTFLHLFGDVLTFTITLHYYKDEDETFRSMSPLGWVGTL